MLQLDQVTSAPRAVRVLCRVSLWFLDMIEGNLLNQNGSLDSCNGVLTDEE